MMIKRVALILAILLAGLQPLGYSYGAGPRVGYSARTKVNERIFERPRPDPGVRADPWIRRPHDLESLKEYQKLDHQRRFLSENQPDADSYFRTARFPGLKFDAAMKGRDLTWLSAPLTGKPLIVSAVEVGHPLYDQLTELSSKGEIPEIKHVQPTREHLIEVLSGVPPNRPTLVFFHRAVTEDVQFISNVAETEKTPWASVAHVFQDADKPLIAFACASKCLLGNKAGIDVAFTEFHAVKVFKHLASARTMYDVLRAINWGTGSDVRVTSKIGAGADDVVVIDVDGGGGSAGGGAFDPPIWGTIPTPSLGNTATQPFTADIDFCEPNSPFNSLDPKCQQYVCQEVQRALKPRPRPKLNLFGRQMTDEQIAEWIREGVVRPRPQLDCSSVLNNAPVIRDMCREMFATPDQTRLAHVRIACMAVPD